MTNDEYRRLRQSLGTQEAVAEMLGVARNTVARRERGDMVLTREAALAMERLVEREETDAA